MHGAGRVATDEGGLLLIPTFIFLGGVLLHVDERVQQVLALGNRAVEAAALLHHQPEQLLQVFRRVFGEEGEPVASVNTS